MQDILNAYIRLLTDVSRRQNVSLDAPEELDTNWILIEAPKLDKELLRFIETGEKFPCFPQWLTPLSEKFHQEHQSLLADLSSESYNGNPIPQKSNYAGMVLKDLRQVLVFGYKAEVQPNAEQLRTAQAAFVETDEGSGIYNVHFERVKDCPFFRHAKALISRVICKIDYTGIKPSHGPGAVFPSCRPSDKANFLSIYKSLDQEFPFYEFFRPTIGCLSDYERFNSEISEVEFISAKLVAVPKDSRGPRLIAVHPKEAIWIQQGIRKALEEAISLSPLTRNVIRFKDQTHNGSLARLSSRSGKYATIDLKDASDSISKELFNYLFSGVAVKFNACRASHIRLLDGSLHELQKYGPMGNATVFPVESLIFWACAVAGIMAKCGKLCTDVHVFGDDIIVPTKYYGYVMQALIRAGLKPNPDKCFHRGLFRESCGVDAYHGIDVTPHRMKKWRLTSLAERISMCSLAKNMRADGYEETASFLYQAVRKREGYLPLGNNPSAQGLYEYVNKDIGYLIRNEEGLKWSSKLHIYVTPITCATAHTDEPSLHDWHHVVDSLVRLSSRGDRPAQPFSYTLPRRIRRKRGWTQAFFSHCPGENPNDDCRIAFDDTDFIPLKGV